jgi:hypothetical protein
MVLVVIGVVDMASWSSNAMELLCMVCGVGECL